MMDAVKEKNWHLDHKVTLSIIIALLMNAVSTVWWASKLDYNVQSNTTRIENTEKQLDEMRDRSNSLYERLARIEANQNFQNEALREIKDVIKGSK